MKETCEHGAAQTVSPLQAGKSTTEGKRTQQRFFEVLAIHLLRTRAQASVSQGAQALVSQGVRESKQRRTSISRVKLAWFDISAPPRGARSRDSHDPPPPPPGRQGYHQHQHQPQQLEKEGRGRPLPNRVRGNLRPSEDAPGSGRIDRGKLQVESAIVAEVEEGTPRHHEL